MVHGLCYRLSTGSPITAPSDVWPAGIPAGEGTAVLMSERGMSHCSHGCPLAREGEEERGAMREENQDEGEEEEEGEEDSGAVGGPEEEEGDEGVPEGASRKARSRGEGSELGADPATAPSAAAAEASCFMGPPIRVVFI